VPQFGDQLERFGRVVIHSSSSLREPFFSRRKSLRPRRELRREEKGGSHVPTMRTGGGLERNRISR